jgi:hypothetical protein
LARIVTEQVKRVFGRIDTDKFDNAGSVRDALAFNSHSQRELAVDDTGENSKAFVAVINLFPCRYFPESIGNTLEDERGRVAFGR